MQNMILQKIQSLEEEIKALKLALHHQPKKVVKPKNKDSLYGILKGVKFSWKDFQDAKKIWHHSESHVK